MVDYQWVPGQDEIVYGSSTAETIPRGHVRQKAWSSPASGPEIRPPDIRGVYVEPIPPSGTGWQPVVWRWADTWRRDAIQRVDVTGAAGGPDLPAYRFELSQADKASEGTAGDHPRAELFSVDPEQKRRTPHTADPPGYFAEGAEYWATFAVFIPDDFPANHRWATLFQRKIDDRYFEPPPHGDDLFTTWLTINVHGTTVDVSAPGYPSFGAQPADQPLCSLASHPTLTDIRGRWAQFVVHEELSATTGSADVELLVDGTSVNKVTLAPFVSGPSFVTFPATPSGVRGFFQYGYYRENAPGSERAGGPGLGFVYATPLLINFTAAAVPQLP